MFLYTNIEWFVLVRFEHLDVSHVLEVECNLISCFTCNDPHPTDGCLNDVITDFVIRLSHFFCSYLSHILNVSYDLKHLISRIGQVRFGSGYGHY